MQDIIIRGGENLFPVQIENVLATHPAISEAASVAVPDPVLGEVVGAWIVREDNAQHFAREDVREFVARGMNPQVRLSVFAAALGDPRSYGNRMPLLGCGLRGKMACLTSCRRRRVGRS